MKKKIYKWIEYLNKDKLIKEGIMILITIILYLLSYFLNVIDCIIIYLLVRINVEKVIEKLDKI